MLNTTAQTFYERQSEPWSRRCPRRPLLSPEERKAREIREMAARYRARMARPRPPPRPVDPERLRQEKTLVGWILLGGSRTLPMMPKTTAVDGFMLRVVLDAVAVLAAQGKPPP